MVKIGLSEMPHSSPGKRFVIAERTGVPIFCTPVPLSLLILVVVSGCSSEETPTTNVTGTELQQLVSGGVVVDDLPADHHCQVVGTIEQSRSGVLHWKVPGSATFYVSLPVPDSVEPGPLMTMFQFDPSKDWVNCGADLQPQFVVENGQLHILARHEVLAPFDTKGQARILVQSQDDRGHWVEIGAVPLKLRLQSDDG